MSSVFSSSPRGAASSALTFILFASSIIGCEDDHLNEISVAVSGAGDGSGFVGSLESAVPIACRIVASEDQGSCSVDVQEAGAGGVFFLVAEADEGSLFAGWQGCSRVINDRCQLSFDPGEDDVSFNVTATFEADPSDPCNVAFGSSPGYVLCSQTADSCTFYTLLNDVDNCNDRCASGGGACLASITDTENTCVAGEAGTCDDVVGDRLCQCTKP